MPVHIALHSFHSEKISVLINILFDDSVSFALPSVSCVDHSEIESETRTWGESLEKELSTIHSMPDYFLMHSLPDCCTPSLTDALPP